MKKRQSKKILRKSGYGRGKIKYRKSTLRTASKTFRKNNLNLRIPVPGVLNISQNKFTMDYTE